MLTVRGKETPYHTTTRQRCVCVLLDTGHGAYEGRAWQVEREIQLITGSALVTLYMIGRRQPVELVEQTSQSRNSEHLGHVGDGAT